MTKLIVPPMPEPSTKDFTQGRIQFWGLDGWQTAQREAALADELAEALKKYGTCRVECPAFWEEVPDPSRPCDCGFHDLIAKHTAARQMNKEARNG